MEFNNDNRDKVISLLKNWRSIIIEKIDVNQNLVEIINQCLSEEGESIDGVSLDELVMEIEAISRECCILITMFNKIEKDTESDKYDDFLADFLITKEKYREKWDDLDEKLSGVMDVLESKGF